MMRGLLPTLLFSSLLALSSGFKTSTCGHDKIIQSFDSYKTCYKKETTAIHANFCHAFDTINTCTRKELSPCFGHDADLIASTYHLDMRRLLKTTLEQLKFSSEIIQSLLESCHQAPTKEEDESYHQKLFYWIDFAETDNRCGKDSVEQVEEGLLTCQKLEVAQFKEELQGKVLKARGNLKATICDTLHDTLGKCWRRDLPSCFTDREITYFRKTMEEEFKAGYDAIKKALIKLSRPEGPQVDVVQCLEGRDE